MGEPSGGSIPPPPGGSGRPSGASTTTCMLLIGDRVVLRATVPPEAEYALFEIGDIELRASEPGRVREHGYQTTVARALERLAQSAITPALARECAASLHPVLSQAYARGPAVRRVARYLGPSELFQAETYDATRGYHGVFLDLPALARDLDLVAASTAMQAVYLAVLLDAEDDETPVFLSTDAWTKHRKPGERTHKRPSLTAVRSLGSALADLARKQPSPEVADHLPRADVIAFLRARADAAPDDDVRALYESLERAVQEREMPDRGPLADGGLWAVELQLDSGRFEGVLEAIEQLEATRGRTPGTTYLRARASLALKLEAPKLVAERVSALALSMTSFQELTLLAAEAWLEAGEARRAMPYARDLVDAPNVDEGLLLKAQRLLARAVGAAPDHHKTIADSVPAAPLPPSTRPPPASIPPPIPPLSMPETGAPQAFEPGKSRVPTARGNQERPPSNPVPAQSASRGPLPPPNPPPTRESARERAAAPSLPPLMPPPLPPLVAPSRPPPVRKPTRPAAADVLPGAPPPPLELDLTPPPKPGASHRAAPSGASFTVDLPGPGTNPPSADARSEPPARSQSGTPGERVSRRPSRTRVTVTEMRAIRSSDDPRAEPESGTSRAVPEAPRDAGRSSGRPAGRPDSHRPTPIRPPSSQPKLEAPVAPRASKAPKAPTGSGAPRANETPFMQGVSLPPYSIEETPPLLARAPLLPKLGGATDELAEHLVLPPGVATDARLDILPRSVLEARVQFTLLARELGLDYRLRRGIELRADLSGIEAMQSVLLEMFPEHTIQTADEAHEVRRHGALLGEILARRLEAEWIDITPRDLGHWAMIVPPNVRVWPFGRVVRLIRQGHKERDLVSYFLELKSRAKSV